MLWQSQMLSSAACPEALLAKRFGADLTQWPHVASKNDQRTRSGCMLLLRKNNFFFKKDPREWGPQVRSIPQTHPALAAGDWKGLARLPFLWPKLDQAFRCPDIDMLTSVKIYNGQLYTFSHGDVLWENRRQQMEMILTAMWLYKDFPNMDFLVASQVCQSINAVLTDCSCAMPHLQAIVCGRLLQSTIHNKLVRLPVWLTPQGNTTTVLQHNGAECRVRTEAPPPHPWRSLSSRKRLRSGNVMLAHKLPESLCAIRIASSCSLQCSLGGQVHAMPVVAS
jgi:hypothetical protein